MPYQLSYTQINKSMKEQSSCANVERFRRLKETTHDEDSLEMNSNTFRLRRYRSKGVHGTRIKVVPR